MGVPNKAPEARTAVLAVTALFILLIMSATLGLAYAISYILTLYGLEPLNLPLGLRLAGLGLVFAGAGVEYYVMRHRRPLEVLVSTSDTLLKLLRRRPVGERTRRTEPFIPNGPYVYTRNPMYLGVVLMAFGLGLAYSSAPLLLWGVVVSLWFSLVLIPFEEKELEALFGDSYMGYKRQVPMLFPSGRKYRRGVGEERRRPVG